MAPKVGEKGVALKVGKKAASHLTPLHASTVDIFIMNVERTSRTRYATCFLRYKVSIDVLICIGRRITRTSLRWTTRFFRSGMKLDLLILNGGRMTSIPTGIWESWLPRFWSLTSPGSILTMFGQNCGTKMVF